MHVLAQKAIKITGHINNHYNYPADIRKWMSLLKGQDLDEGFCLFPPFYTDSGKNIHIDKNLFINSVCNFQDKEGIYMGKVLLLGIELF